MPVVFVVIATAYNRVDWLISQSLLSVYNQTGVDKKTVRVLVIDDNGMDEKHLSFIKLKKKVTELRAQLNLESFEFETLVIPNTRTRNYSGTGAWNTGIFHAFDANRESYVSILDDDDEYLPHHLSDCFGAIESNPDILCVFQEIKWQLENETELYFPLDIEDLNPSAFFIGNPGVQGSNLFVKSWVLNEIEGFDETFKSTTDRDLMIRLLRYIEVKYQDKAKVLKTLAEPGVIHHCHQKERVTTNLKVKHDGLDRFYEKYRLSFSKEYYLKSLKRASFLFQYKNQYV